MEPEPTVESPKKQKQAKKHLIVVGVFFVIGFLVLSAGISLLIYNQDTDSEGYVYSNLYHINTTTYAFTAYMNEFKTSTWGWLGPENVAQIKFIVRNQNPTKELFTGYATTRQSELYRQSFKCEIPTYWYWHTEPYDAEIYINTTIIEGDSAPATLPQTQTFWLTTAQSADTATMIYLPQHEQHIWFIMNSDGSQNITADIQIGFKSPILAILPIIFLPVGILLLLIGTLVLRKKKKKIIPMK